MGESIELNVSKNSRRRKVNVLTCYQEQWSIPTDSTANCKENVETTSASSTITLPLMHNHQISKFEKNLPTNDDDKFLTVPSSSPSTTRRVSEEAGLEEYVVNKDDTLASIAASRGSSTMELMGMNKLMNFMLYPGQILLVPTKNNTNSSNCLKFTGENNDKYDPDDEQASQQWDQTTITGVHPSTHPLAHNDELDGDALKFHLKQQHQQRQQQQQQQYQLLIQDMESELNDQMKLQLKNSPKQQHFKRQQPQQSQQPPQQQQQPQPQQQQQQQQKRRTHKQRSVSEYVKPHLNELHVPASQMNTEDSSSRDSSRKTSLVNLFEQIRLKFHRSNEIITNDSNNNNTISTTITNNNTNNRGGRTYTKQRSISTSVAPLRSTIDSDNRQHRISLFGRKFTTLDEEGGGGMVVRRQVVDPMELEVHALVEKRRIPGILYLRDDIMKFESTSSSASPTSSPTSSPPSSPLSSISSSSSSYHYFMLDMLFVSRVGLFNMKHDDDVNSANNLELIPTDEIHLLSSKQFLKSSSLSSKTSILPSGDDVKRNNDGVKIVVGCDDDVIDHYDDDDDENDDDNGDDDGNDDGKNVDGDDEAGNNEEEHIGTNFVLQVEGTFHECVPCAWVVGGKLGTIHFMVSSHIMSKLDNFFRKSMPHHYLNLDAELKKNLRYSMKITLKQCTDLPDVNEDGTLNACAKFKHKGSTVYKTGVVRNGLNPTFNITFTSDLLSLYSCIAIKLYHWFSPMIMSCIGQVEVQCSTLVPLVTTQLEMKLKNSKIATSDTIGCVHLDCQLLPEDSTGVFPFVQYPSLTTPSGVFNDSHVRRLYDSLPSKMKANTSWGLVYSTDVHGSSLMTLYAKMKLYNKNDNVILIIKDSYQHIFGAFLTSSIRLSNSYYGNGECFLFCFHPLFQKFGWSGDNNWFIKGNDDSLMIGGGGHVGLWLLEDLYSGRSDICGTFDNIPLTPHKDFHVMLLEIWIIQ